MFLVDRSLATFFFAHQGMWDIYWMKKVGAFCFQAGIESNYKERVGQAEYRTIYLVIPQSERNGGVVDHLGGGQSLKGMHGPEMKINGKSRIPNTKCHYGF